MTPTNEELERHYFENFGKFYNLPDGTLEYDDKPDVILSVGGKKIGIEITNFYLQRGESDKSEQRQKPLREAVVTKAYCRHIAEGGESFGLTVEFDVKYPIDPRKVERLARDLASFANLPRKQSSRYIDQKFFQNKAPEIASIQRCEPGFLDTKWRIAQVYSTPLTRKSDIEAIVQKKEGKIAEYKACDAYWLLIVIEGMEAGQDQEIKIEPPSILSNQFEKVILFHTFGHVTEAIVTSSSI
jgi:hypothetical protein